MMIEDITSEEEEKQEMFELRKNKALSRVIAGMAHEIKNPLMSIRTFASLIPAQGRDDDFQEMFAQHVPKEIERINHLIDMLINYTRPIRTNKEHVSVNELVDDAVFFARISCKDKEKIICQSEVSVKTYIYVNKDQIRQALINLIMNSIQSMEEKLLEHEDRIEENLRMHLSAYKRQDRICIEVRDDGCGMTESEIEKCIEPFFTTKAKGLGMGLALTKQFVDENSGKLEFESIKNEFTSIRMVFEEDTKV